jgi:hypothetical protein
MNTPSCAGDRVLPAARVHARVQAQHRLMRPWLLLAACAIGLAACGGGTPVTGTAAPAEAGRAGALAAAPQTTQTAQSTQTSQVAPPFNFGRGPSLQLLSSAPAFVSGGDARIAVRAVPGLRPQLGLWLNGIELGMPLAETSAGFEGVLDGLALGTNVLELRRRTGPITRVVDQVTLTNHPVTGPMFTGPQQQPFV